MLVMVGLNIINVPILDGSLAIDIERVSSTISKA